MHGLRHAGYAVAAIDGIGHGDRASATTTADRRPGQGISRTFVAEVAAAADAMTADWTVVLRELRELDDVGDGPLGYGGVSMGTSAPFVAATPEVRCAVLELASALFRSIGSRDKRLHAHPRAHAAVPVEEMEASEALFASHLT